MPQRLAPAAMVSVAAVVLLSAAFMAASSQDATDESQSKPSEQPSTNSQPQTGAQSSSSDANSSSNLFGNEQAPAAASNQTPAAAGQPTPGQNAVLEGIQLSSEPGQAEKEKVVSCYFIFRDKPSSYFYEAKPNEKKLVFEFNDAQLGASPIPSLQESPIQGFRIEPTKVNVNAEVKGLTPEWHDVLKISFYLDNIPEISVKDEYSVISYSFKWSTDPEKVKKYIRVDSGKRARTLIFSVGGGVGLAAAAGIIWYFLQPPPPPPEKSSLTISDLPMHPTPY